MLGYGRINLVVLSLKTNKRLLDVPFQACHNRSVLQQPHPLQDTNQHGAVAHLVERCIRIAEVGGSSPPSSTITEPGLTAGFCVANHLTSR